MKSGKPYKINTKGVEASSTKAGFYENFFAIKSKNMIKITPCLKIVIYEPGSEKIALKV